MLTLAYSSASLSLRRQARGCGRVSSAASAFTFAFVSLWFSWARVSSHLLQVELPVHFSLSSRYSSPGRADALVSSRAWFTQEDALNRAPPRRAVSLKATECFGCSCGFPFDLPMGARAPSFP